MQSILVQEATRYEPISATDPQHMRIDAWKMSAFESGRFWSVFHLIPFWMIYLFKSAIWCSGSNMIVPGIVPLEKHSWIHGSWGRVIGSDGRDSLSFQAVRTWLYPAMLGKCKGLWEQLKYERIWWIVGGKTWWYRQFLGTVTLFKGRITEITEAGFRIYLRTSPGGDWEWPGGSGLWSPFASCPSCSGANCWRKWVAQLLVEEIPNNHLTCMKPCK